MRNKTVKKYGAAARPKQLHDAGLVRNAGPKAARQRREMDRLVANIRKVLWRRPGRLILWVERDLAQARRAGSGFFSNRPLEPPYKGRIVGIGNRALLVLEGSPPAPEVS